MLQPGLHSYAQCCMKPHTILHRVAAHRAHTPETSTCWAVNFWLSQNGWMGINYFIISSSRLSKCYWAKWIKYGSENKSFQRGCDAVLQLLLSQWKLMGKKYFWGQCALCDGHHCLHSLAALSNCLTLFLKAQSVLDVLLKITCPSASMAPLSGTLHGLDCNSNVINMYGMTNENGNVKELVSRLRLDESPLYKCEQHFFNNHTPWEVLSLLPVRHLMSEIWVCVLESVFMPQWLIRFGLSLRWRWDVG